MFLILFQLQRCPHIHYYSLFLFCIVEFESVECLFNLSDSGQLDKIWLIFLVTSDLYTVKSEWI